MLNKLSYICIIKQKQFKTKTMTTTNNTYDIIFNDNNNSNGKCFTICLESAKNYINSNNGTNASYFADYKGGTVSIVCNETEETVFETEVF